jgi:Domain of unknown function (DUF4268)
MPERPPDALPAQGDGAATETPVGPAGASGASPAPTSSAPVAEPPVFGRLEAVPLRKYFQDEARDFTPWLAKEENLTLLAETIGLNLELVAMEQYIGPFRADIVAKDEEVEVIVENQLDATDHRHLGQLMVYAANRGAGVIVWIARQVTDEYRKVIDWLNEETNVNFFALEVELWRITGSPVAPKFNIVCEPNEVARAVRSTGEPSETAQLQLEFWTGFVEAMSDRDWSFNTPKVGPRHWCDLRIGTSRGHIGLTALRNGRLSCELYIGHSQSSVIFERLEGERVAIEVELGLQGELDWQPLPEKKSCRIALYKDIGSLDDRAKWPEAFEWMLSWAEKFKSVFAQRVKDIVLPEPAQVTDEEARAAATEPIASAELAQPEIPS